MNINDPMGGSNSLTEGQPKIFKIGRYKYAFGLHWQTPDNPKEMAREAKKLAKMDGFKADLYLERRKVAPQYALGRSQEGLLAGAIGAAAIAAHALRGASAWMGIFRVGEGFWFVSVRDDFVLPDGDCYYADENEARDRFDRERRQGGWLKYYAPDGWIDGAEEVPVTQFLGMERGATLSDVNPFAKRIKTIAAVAAIVAVSLVGLTVFKKTQDVSRNVLVQAEAERKLKELETGKNATKYIAAEWASQPNPGDLIETCLDGMRRLPTSAPGYTFRSLSCSKGALTASFERDGGVAGWFEAWGRSEFGAVVFNGAPITPNVFNDGKIATMNGAIVIPPQRKNAPGWDIGLHRVSDAMRALYETSQILGDKISVGPPTRPQSQAGVPVDKEKKAFYAPAHFNLGTRDPDAWGTYLKDFPGVVVQSVEFDSGTNEWRIQGDIYVRI